MALTRFVSTSASTPAINQVNMNPSIAAIPAQAALESAKRINADMDQFFNVLNQKKKEEEHELEQYYIQNARADLQLSASQAERDTAGKIQYGGNYGNDLVSAFDSTATQVLDQAPTDRSRKILSFSLTNMRKSLYSRGDFTQNSFNEKYEIDDFSKKALELSSIAIQSDGAASEIKKQLKGLSESLLARGRNPLEVEKRYNASVEVIDKSRAFQSADENPLGTLQKIKDGDFNQYGPDFHLQLKRRAEAVIEGQSKQVESTLNNLIDRLEAGQTIPIEADLIVDKAKELGNEKAVYEYDFLLEVNNRIRKSSVDQLGKLRENVIISAAKNPSISPDLRDRALRMINTMGDMAEKDPIVFAAQQQVIGQPGSLPDPSDPEFLGALREREKFALQAQSALKTKNVISLTDTESTQFAAQLKDASPTEKLEQLSKYAAGLSPASFGKLMNSLDKENPTDMIGALISRDSPEIARKIFVGQSKLPNVKNRASSLSPDAIMNSTFKDLYSGNPEVRQKIYNAALALAASEVSEISESDITSALNEVTGHVRIGGFWSKYDTVVPDLTMTQDDMTNLIEAISTKDRYINYGNGVPVFANGEKVDPQKYSINELQLTPLSPFSGIYKVVKGDAEITTEDGSTFLLDLKKAYSDFKKGM